LARLVDQVTNCSEGERLFLSVTQRCLDDTYIVYHNRTLCGREFDVCILLPSIGILVVEVKGWHASSVSEVLDGHRILIRTEHGEDTAAPRRQARGYRHMLEQHIYRELGKRPLVFEMVAYPFITRADFFAKGMQAVSEENFTFLHDDMVSPYAFKSKLDAAVTLTRVWHRDHFGVDLEDQVRSMFEPQYKPPAREPLSGDNGAGDFAVPHSSWLVPLYSQLSYLPYNYQKSKETVDSLLRLYAQGTKVWLLTPHSDLLAHAEQALSQLLADKGLQWENKRLQPSVGKAVKPPRWVSGESFSCFNFEAVLCPAPAGNVQSISIVNGEGVDAYSEQLKQMQSQSAFNYDQFLIEHAPATKNVLVRAGAGTGKTHVMISRIAYLCYTDSIFARALLQRIVMITFTNEATENMKKRLKRHFQDYYLLTGQPGFLEMIGYVDGMQISTIDSYARAIIEKICTALGLGQEIKITSGVAVRRETLEQLLEQYVEEKKPRDLMPRMGLAVYELKRLLLELLDKLNNRNVAIASLDRESFGPPLEGDDNEAFHNVVSEIVPRTEREMNKILRGNNTVHLSLLMSTLREAVSQGSQQLAALKGAFPHYLFVDEFQDTDDVQIAALTKIAECLGSRLFVVGDIKQCIFRFRGADEQAFSLLSHEHEREKWFLSVLNQNYRTDAGLLTAFSRSFVWWSQKGLLRYEQGEKELSSRLHLNSNKSEGEYYRRLSASSRDTRLQVLFDEVRHYQRVIKSLITSGEELSPEERTIAILVRENWQAEEVRKRGLDENLPPIETHQGGDLFKSPPALDLLTLVQALINNQQPKHLYALLTSNLFNLPVSKKVMYDLRYSSLPGSPRDRQLEYLVSTYNNAVAQIVEAVAAQLTWNELLKRLRTEPVLQVLRELYQLLRPWERYSSEERLQHFYHLNIDLVFERIIGALNVDNLTLHSMAEHLQMCVATQLDVECRWPDLKSLDIGIKCVTVHKAKGLEYGFVIVPYADFPIDKLRDDKLDVTFVNGKVGYRVGNADSGRVLGTTNYNETTEVAQRIHEETRNLYVAMTRSIRGFSWIHIDKGMAKESWQSLLAGGGGHAL